MVSNSDYEFFKSKLPDFLRGHRGEFVLIKNQQEHGFYLSEHAALKAGLEKFGNTDFLIQEVTDEIRVNYINLTFISQTG